jgi:hypothetical protein
MSDSLKRFVTKEPCQLGRPFPEIGGIADRALGALSAPVITTSTIPNSEETVCGPKNTRRPNCRVVCF